MTTESLEFATWLEPGSTLSDLLIAEPNSVIEGPTSDVLRTLFAVSVGLFTTSMPHGAAVNLALRHMAETHLALVRSGYVIRDVACDL